jgi:Glyoxalase/Bleomycin resistance protein/Dioxygenase superfamily
MAREVGEQDVKHVVVNCDVVHITIVIIDQPFNEKRRWLELGIPDADTRIVLFQFGGKLQPGGQLNIALWSDDVEGTARELKARGVEFVLKPKRQPYGTTSISKDVDGNCLVLSSR